MLIERWRWSRFFSLQVPTRLSVVREHELDMDRRAHKPPSSIMRLAAALQWLAPGSHRMGPPTRAVDRDVADSWPMHR